MIFLAKTVCCCSSLSLRLAKPSSSIRRPYRTGRQNLQSGGKGETAGRMEPPPIKFSESAAFIPRHDRERPDRPPPSAKPLTFWEDVAVKGSTYKTMNRASFLASLLVFMGYFLVLREENEMDEELTKPLWQRLPSVEEKVLHERIILGKSRGEDVSSYEERYQQLQEEKQKEYKRLSLGKR